MRILITVLIIFFISTQKRLAAQIVNIESLRSFVDTGGFHGLENFSINYTRNTRELLRLTNTLSLKYKRKRSSWLFLNTIDVSLAGEEVLEQNLFLHLRYNFRQNDWLIYEVFTQYQKNVPLRIQTRMLWGLGPRFTIVGREKFSFHIGSIIMYEHDDELGNDIINRDVRLSNYVAVNFKLEDRVTWANYIYYQPRVDKFEDFRTSLQTQLQFKIFKSLKFATTLDLAYDAFPVDAPAIPNLTVNWVNGISYSF